MSRVFLYVFLFFSSISFAQTNINAYKYILVPQQFEFQKSQDQFQFNSLTKFLFNREGFNVLYTDEVFPLDLASNGCLGLKVRVNNNSSMFKTKMNIDLVDCYNKVIYSSKEGVSRIKDFKKAYQQALRGAFSELEDFNYKYTGDATNNEIKKEKKTEKILKQPKEEKIKKVISSDHSKSIEGTFNFQNWGEGLISKKGDYFTVVGGDENFQFATIYRTSKPLIFIIKWASFKQPQLLEINLEGNLKVDSKNGIKLFKRID